MEKIPTPALSKGLKILELIHYGGEKTLSELTRESRFPKSSVARYLETLESAGYIERSAISQKFKLNCKISKSKTGPSNLKDLLPRLMKALVQATGFTAEWYERHNELAVVKQIYEPENVSVKVVTKFNFERRLDRELDAVTRLFIANDQRPGSMPAYFIRNWEKQINLSETDALRLIEDAGKQKVVVDNFFNLNGVRRCAVALHNCHGQFSGVLALAGHYHPTSHKVLNKGIRLLSEYLENYQNCKGV